MKVCEACGQGIPESQLPPDVRVRKQLALDLMGRDIRFAHEAPGVSPRRVTVVTDDGMVVVTGLAGAFAPHLFVKMESGRP